MGRSGSKASGRRRVFLAVATAAVAAVLGGIATAEEPKFTRGDLARALRRFERAWDDARDSLDEEKLGLVAGHVSKATFAFFASSTEPACAELARATAELRGTEPSREALALHAVPVLVPAGDFEAELVVGRPSELVGRAERALAVAFVDSNGTVLERATVAIGAGERARAVKLAQPCLRRVFGVSRLERGGLDT